jgi:hypothetical protein
MFASLLPGVRHVRAPLAAGFLWLSGAWLLLADQIPDQQVATGGLRTLIDLGNEIGRVPLGVVAAFAAYVVGTAAAQLFGRFTRELSGVVQLLRGLPPSESPGIRGDDPGILFTFTAESSIKATASDRLGEVRRRAFAANVDPDAIIGVTTVFSDEEDYQIFHAEHPRSWDKWNFLIDQAQRRSIREFELLATRLMTSDPQLFAELDRHRAEAELRYQLVPALVFADIALAFTWTPWCLLALPLVAFLFVQGMHSAERAGDIVADAALVGQVAAPAVERVARIADELIQAGPPPA